MRVFIVNFGRVAADLETLPLAPERLEEAGAGAKAVIDRLEDVVPAKEFGRRDGEVGR